jgi:hypothetical protein
MTDDLVKRLRRGPLQDDYETAVTMNDAADRIEKLEAALYEIAHLNNMRDRFSSEIDTVISNVLGEKND